MKIIRVSDTLHRALRLKAADSGDTLQSTVEKVLSNGLKS